MHESELNISSINHTNTDTQYPVCYRFLQILSNSLHILKNLYESPIPISSISPIPIPIPILGIGIGISAHTRYRSNSSVDKCHQLHVGSKKYCCPDLHVDNWRVEKIDEAMTGFENLKDVQLEEHKLDKVESCNHYEGKFQIKKTGSEGRRI